MKQPARTIWIISKYFASRAYGFETRSVAIARKWAATGRRPVIIASDSNHLADFPPLQSPVVDEDADGVRFRWLRTLRYSRSASARRALSWLDFELQLWKADVASLPRPDVIIVSSLSLLTVLNGIRLARKFQVPWVFEVRDIWPLTLVEEGGYSRWHPLALLLGAIEKIGYRKADLVIGTMPNLSEHATEVAGRHIDAHCVPFGFEPSQVALAESTPASAPAVSRPEGAGLIIGYGGSIGIANALDTLIDCIVELREDRRFKFVMLGDGDRKEHFMSRTAGCHNIDWIGRVPRSEVHGYLTQCDLLYFAATPSKVWKYGMSLNKLTDYLLAARPILASYSGFPSVLNEAECGRFIPAGEPRALLEALETFRNMPSAARSAMGAKGRDWFFQHRTWQKLADNYAVLLDAIVERHGERSRGTRADT